MGSMALIIAFTNLDETMLNSNSKSKLSNCKNCNDFAISILSVYYFLFKTLQIYLFYETIHRWSLL